MKKLFFVLFIVAIFGVGFFWKKITSKINPSQTSQTTIQIPKSEPQTEIPPKLEPPSKTESKPKPKAGWKTLTLVRDSPGKELADEVGFENVFKILALNRIDDKHLWKGMSLTVPGSRAELDDYAFMPVEIVSALTIPKLIIVSQQMQSFGIYENGKLARSGPVSSGKQSTPTKSDLYFTNWKGKEVVSTFDDEWILKWNFNIDNREGVSLHEYVLPGYPASHSCVRFYGADAEWIFNWADQWVLSHDGQTKLASGTPVIIFGDYDFESATPWSHLPKDQNATTISQDEIEEIVSSNLSKIEKERALRTNILSTN